ncbi:MAG: hypothetical protein U0790_07615 [Isosphaeraceae bacterium]
MTPGQWLLLLVLAAAVLFALRGVLRDRLSPTRRALRRAEKGDTERALADLSRRLERRPGSAAVLGARGRVHLLARRLPEAEADLRGAVELGSRDPFDLDALGWCLVAQERLDEAFLFALQAHEQHPEDFSVHCLYCGLMAHQGRGEEVVPLLDFLKRRAHQLRNQHPAEYEARHAARFEFACREMDRAGFS